MDLSNFSLPDFGPLSILICWQSLVIAIGVATITHGIKTAIDVGVGGSAKRQNKIWVNRVILPATPIVIGCLAAIFIPLHPDALLQYIKDHAIVGGKSFAILGAYGVVLGQFSDYVWHRFSGVTQDYKKRGKHESLAAGPPQPEPKPDAPSDPPKGP